MKKYKWQNTKIDNLFNAILKIQDVDEAYCFFRDILTIEEINEMSNRWKVACMLANKYSYSEIVKETKMSSTTVARISKWLNSGMGGYKLLIKRTKHTNLV